MKSGKLTKEFRGHTSFVNSAAFSADGTRVYSASSDGTAKIWDAKTQDCIRTIALARGMAAPHGASSPTALLALPLPRGAGDRFLVCNRSPWAYIVDGKGAVVRALTALADGGAGMEDGNVTTQGESKQQRSLGAVGLEHVAAATSPKGEYVYAATEGGTLHAFLADTGRAVASWTVAARGGGGGAGAEVVGVAAHPFANILAVYSDDGVVSLWRQ